MNTALAEPQVDYLQEKKGQVPFWQSETGTKNGPVPLSLVAVEIAVGAIEPILADGAEDIDIYRIL